MWRNLIILVGKSTFGYILVDKLYFERYSYCGQMATENSFIALTLEDPSTEKTASGRITNSKPPTESYRWVVRIITSNLKTDGRIIRALCSGTVITER